MRTLPILVLVAASSVVVALPVGAQTEYRNTDGSHPLRIEDAEASARHSLDFEIAPIRVDRFASSVYRMQLEPRVAYAAFPRTELKFRAPFAYREAGSTPRGGLVGIGLGVFHTVMIESPRMPALAVEGEALFPAGGSATNGKTYGFRGIATRTFGQMRLHSNVAYGTFRVQVPNAPVRVPPVPDGPCSVGDQPSAYGGLRAAALCMPSESATSSAAQVSFSERGGSRWLFGLGADRAFPLRSILIGGDVFAERYSGDTRPVDWTAELAVRKQMTPRTILESAVGRRFTGLTPAWFISAGVSSTISARLLIPEAR